MHESQLVEQSTSAPTKPEIPWLAQHITALNPSGDFVLDLKKSIALAMEFGAGAELPDASMMLVFYAQSQITFLNQFSRFGGQYCRATTPDVVALKLECSSDVLQLKRLFDEVASKAPGSRLEREAEGALQHAVNDILVRANDGVR